MQSIRHRQTQLADELVVGIIIRIFITLPVPLLPTQAHHLRAALGPLCWYSAARATLHVHGEVLIPNLFARSADVPIAELASEAEFALATRSLDLRALTQVRKVQHSTALQVANELQNLGDVCNGKAFPELAASGLAIPILKLRK